MVLFAWFEIRSLHGNSKSCANVLSDQPLCLIWCISGDLIIQSTADATLPRGWNSVPVENIVKSKLAIALYPTTWSYVSYILNLMRQSQKAHSGRSRAHVAVSTEQVHKRGHCSVNRVHLLLWPTMAVYYVIHVALIAWSRASNFLCIVVLPLNLIVTKWLSLTRGSVRYAHSVIP